MCGCEEERKEGSPAELTAELRSEERAGDDHVQKRGVLQVEGAGCAESPVCARSRGQV